VQYEVVSFVLNHMVLSNHRQETTVIPIDSACEELSGLGGPSTPCNVPFPRIGEIQEAQGLLRGYKFEGHKNRLTLMRWRGMLPQRRAGA
jgi:hypothetical protein